MSTAATVPQPYEPVLPILRAELLSIVNRTSDPLAFAHLAAGCLAQMTNRPLPLENLALDDYIRVIASCVPQPFTVTSEIPEDVRKVLTRCKEAFCPSTTPPDRGQGPVPAQTTVETVAEKETRERYITIHRVKYPRVVDGYYAVFYPHMWIGKTAEAWLACYAGLSRNLIIPDIHTLKYEALLTILKGWFSWTSTVLKADELTEPQTTTFNAIAEQAAELYLLMVSPSNVKRHTAPNAQVTATFFAAVTKRKHDPSQPVNFYQDLKDASGTKPFRDK
jgi:hypothetical protein